MEDHFLEIMAGAACSGMPWSLGLVWPGWGCVGCRRWPSQHIQGIQGAEDVQIHVSHEQLRQRAFTGPLPTYACKTGQSLEG